MTIQQRKPPARRAFLAGSYLNTEATTPEPEVEPTEPTPQVTPDKLGPLRYSEEAQLLEKQKEAERGRTRRKSKRDQLAAIKLALKTPIAVILAAEEDQHRLEVIRERESKPDSMSRGISVTGGGKLVTGGHTTKKLDHIAAAAMQAESLGAPTDGNSWPDHDRRKGKPEGTSAGSDDSKNTGVHDDKDVVAKFVVKEGTDLDWGQALQNLFHTMFFEIDDGYVCRLCRAYAPSERRCQEHLEKYHGEDSEPDYDSRFSNVVGKEARTVRGRRTRSGRSK
jgi:hypothetical protein